MSDAMLGQAVAGFSAIDMYHGACHIVCILSVTLSVVSSKVSIGIRVEVR